jgi:hypothetical protein
VDGFTLGIQNALLQRNVDVGFHQLVDYTSGGSGQAYGFRYKGHTPGPHTLVTRARKLFKRR